MQRDFIIIASGRVLQIVIMLVSIRILTSILSPEEVGNYYLILSLLTFFNLVFLNPSGMYFTRHLLHWQRQGHLSNALVVIMICASLVAIISIPVTAAAYLFFGFEEKFPLSGLLFFVAISCVVGTLHRNLVAGINTLGFRKEFIFYVLTTLLLGLIISVLLASQYHNALSWLFGVVFSEALILYWAYRFFKQDHFVQLSKIKSSLTKKKIKQVLLFTLPIAMTTLLMWGQSSSYRFIVDYYYSTEILGFIAIGLSVASAIFGAVESIAIQYFSPIFLKNILDANQEQRAAAWNKIANVILPIYILVAIFTIAMSEILVSILLDEKFHSAYQYTRIGVGIEFFRVLINLLYKVSQSEHKTSYTIMPYLVGSLITLCSLLTFDFSQSLYMIPSIMVISSFVIFIYMHINMNKLLALNYGSGLLIPITLTSPFFLVYFWNAKLYGIIWNLVIMGVFGLYFLFLLWVLYGRKSMMDDET